MVFVDGKQFIRFKYLHHQPSLMVFDYSSAQYEYISIAHPISLKKSTQKYCIGSYDLTHKKWQPCEQQVNLSGTQYIRCRDCESRTEFMECVKCNGLTCRTRGEQAIAYCNQDHAVYLAYFPGGLIKVGISMWRRRKERIIEQGAVAAIFICRTNGKIAREIEYYIGKTGIKTRVTSDYKLKNLWVDQSENEIKNLLTKTFDFLTKEVLHAYAPYRIEPMFFSQYDRFHLLKQAFKETSGQLTMDFLGQAYTSQDYRFAKNFDELGGEMITCIGSILVVRQSQEIVAYCFSRFIGHLILIEGLAQAHPNIS